MWKSVIGVGALAALVACSDQGGTQAEAPKAEAAPAAEEAPAQPSVSAQQESASSKSEVPVDGDLELPTDYTNWPVFLADIQKPETKQIRDIYLNDAAASAEAAPLPDGSILVMEIYTVATDDAGEAITDAEGNMTRKDLSKVFVMGKNPGWGTGLPDGLANGNWIYSAFEADGSPAEVDYNSCRACHAPLGSEDYVHRYNEYLAER